VDITDCGPKLGLKGVDNGRLSFSGVRVPREALLNRFADVSPDGVYTSSIEGADRRFFTMLGTLVQGRVSLAAGGVGASKVALTIAIRYAATRRQFSPSGTGPEATLLSYATHQRRLLPLLAATYALSASQHDVTLLLHESFSDDYIGDGRRVLESRAAGQKALATWHATRTIQEAREACGGAGYLAENRLAALKADTDVFTTFEGDNTILLQLVAKGMLTELRRTFGDLDSTAKARAVAAQAVGVAVERASLRPLGERARDAVPGNRADRALRDLGYLRDLLTWREAHMRSGLARRLRRGVAASQPAAEVFARCQEHAAAMARAHMERVTFDSFAESIRRSDPDVREVLTRLCQLYALSLIEADRGWFLEHGRLSAARSKAVTAMVSRLCRELAPVAERLTDGFAIPEELVRAPIARRQ
jgi:acyl-CoA oxidase